MMSKLRYSQEPPLSTGRKVRRSIKAVHLGLGRGSMDIEGGQEPQRYAREVGGEDEAKTDGQADCQHLHRI